VRASNSGSPALGMRNIEAPRTRGQRVGEKHCANQKPRTAKQAQRVTPVERLFQRRHWLVAPLDSQLSSRCRLSNSVAHSERLSTCNHISPQQSCISAMQRQSHFLHRLSTGFVKAYGLSSSSTCNLWIMQGSRLYRTLHYIYIAHLPSCPAFALHRF
jgi:hypothetical protein